MDHDHEADSDLVPQVSSEAQEEIIDHKKPRGLLLKIKIPKPSFDGEDRAGREDLDGSEIEGHVCNFCGKKFSCGKALGGHVRVHMIKTGRGKKMVARTGSNLRPKLSEEEDREEEAEIERREVVKVNNAVKCCLCSKEFRSMKSLFGHMRNHPGRGWRGIRPPEGEIINNNNTNNNSCSSSSTVSENELPMSLDLVRALPKGPKIVRAKRRIEALSDEVPQAAYILMKIAYSGQNIDLGKLVRNPSFVYEDDDEEERKLGQFKGEVTKEKKKRKSNIGPRRLKLDFDLNQPYVALDDGEGTLDQN